MNLRSVLFCILLSWVSYFAHAQESLKDNSKVAIIVNVGSAGPLGAFTRHNTELAEETYKKQGYEVIVLTNDSEDPSKWATQTNLKAQIEKLSGKTNLKLDINGHGDLINLSEIDEMAKKNPDLKRRYPQVKHPEALINGGFTGKDISLPNTFIAKSRTPEVARLGDLAREAQIKSPDEKKKAEEAADKAEFDASLGVGDIRDILLSANKNNPGLKTNVNVLNCFGGSLGQEISDIPGVSVYTAAESTKLAIDLPDLKTPSSGNAEIDAKTTSRNYVYLLNEKINSSLSTNPKQPITLNEAHEYAADALFDRLFTAETTMADMLGFNLPLSARQNYVLGWCNRFENQTKNNANDSCKVDSFFEKENKTATDNQNVSRQLLAGELSENIRRDEKTTKKVLNLISEHQAKQCDGKETYLKNDKETRFLISDTINKNAFQKIKDRVSNLESGNVEDLKKKLKDRNIKKLKDAYEAATAKVMGADSEKWQYEKGEIEKAKLALDQAINQPFDLIRFKMTLMGILNNLEKTGCFAADSQNCKNPGKNMGQFNYLINEVADIFEPLPKKSDDPSYLPRVCAKEDPPKPKKGELAIVDNKIKTISEMISENQKTIACIRKNEEAYPIRLASETHAGAGVMAFNEPAELCERYANEKKLYEYRLSCDKNFMTHASSDEKNAYQDLVIDSNTPL